MKMIKYPIYQNTLENGEVIIFPKDIPWNEANEEIAKREAYNGEYEIVDDGQPDPIQTSTLEEEVEALKAAVTMLCMPDMEA